MHLTVGEQHHRQYCLAKKKKIVKKKNQKGTTQAALRCVGAGSELAGAAGVALQEAHDGRVALGPSDELFQGEFA